MVCSQSWGVFKHLETKSLSRPAGGDTDQESARRRQQVLPVQEAPRRVRNTGTRANVKMSLSRAVEAAREGTPQNVSVDNVVTKYYRLKWTSSNRASTPCIRTSLRLEMMFTNVKNRDEKGHGWWNEDQDLDADGTQGVLWWDRLDDKMSQLRGLQFPTRGISVETAAYSSGLYCQLAE